jgi:hypothetical protein
MALTLSAAAANAMGDALGALLNGGHVHLYTSPRPATVDTAITTQTLLAAPTFGNPAFASAVAGVITANALTADASAAASGTAAWFRAVTSAGAAVCDGSVGTSNADCILSSTTIIAYGSISVTSCVLTVPEHG